MRAAINRHKALASLVGVLALGAAAGAVQTCSCSTPVFGTTTTPAGSWTPVTNANVAISPPPAYGGTGNNVSCTVSGRKTATAVASLVPCASWQTACNLALPGDTIAVMGVPVGTTSGVVNGYPGSAAGEGALYLTPCTNATTTPITFACGNANPVQFSPYNGTNLAADQVVVTASYVTITGQCFYFNSRLFVGDPQNGNPTPETNHDVIDNVRAVNIQITGTDHTTVQNSTLGPSTECLPPGNGAMSCQNNDVTGETYFYQRGTGNCSSGVAAGCNGAFYNNKIHSGFALVGGATRQPTNFLWTGNTMTNYNGRDLGPTTDHDECMFLDWGSPGSGTISNNTFTGCVVFDTFANTQSTGSVTFSGNTFNQIVNTLPSGATNYSGVTLGTPRAELDWACRGTNLTMTGIVLTGNTFANGYLLNDDLSCSPSYSGVVINSNTLNGLALNVPSQPQP